MCLEKNTCILAPEWHNTKEHSLDHLEIVEFNLDGVTGIRGQGPKTAKWPYSQGGKDDIISHPCQSYVTLVVVCELSADRAFL